MTACGAVADFRNRILRADAGAESILGAADSFPDDAMVQLCAAALHLYGQTDAGHREAAGFLDRAASLGGRDEGLLDALRHWQGLRYREATTALEAMTERDPSNLLAAKFSEFLYYVMGQQHCGQRFRVHMERLAPHHSADPDFLSMYSFSQELCGNFSEARRLAESSLEIEARNPWAEHTLSHVTIRQGDIDEGEQRLRDFLTMAATCARPVHSHTAWHLALFDLERLDHARALEIYHEHIWGITPDLIGEQVDAIALLWRLEMAGREVSKEWKDVAGHVEAYARQCYMPFISVHHAYALARAGSTAALDALSSAVENRAGEDDLWREVGVPVVNATVAFAEGDWQMTADLLQPVMPQMTAIGGSDAQDDLIRQTFFVALARSGRKAEALSYWKKFCDDKTSTPLDEYFVSLA